LEGSLLSHAGKSRLSSQRVQINPPYVYGSSFIREFEDFGKSKNREMITQCRNAALFLDQNNIDTIIMEEERNGR
jgi:hypothetical protein